MPVLTADSSATPASGSRPVAPASPRAERLEPPRWRDGRLLAGVVLVLVSVVVGSRVVSASDTSIEVVTAVRSLPAGHVIVAGDLARQRVRLFAGNADHYWASKDSSGLVGERLLRQVDGGDFLPRGAVGPATPGPSMADVPVVVDPARLPSVPEGAMVDLWVTYGAHADVAATVVRLVSGAEVVAAPDLSDVGSGKVTLLLRVPREQVAAVVRASETGDIDVVALVAPSMAAR